MLLLLHLINELGFDEEDGRKGVLLLSAIPICGRRYRSSLHYSWSIDCRILLTNCNGISPLIEFGQTIQLINHSFHINS